MVGKSAIQSEDVKGTALSGKLMSWLPRKAAIVYMIPVPKTDTGG